MQVVVVEEDGEAKGVLCLEIGSMIRFQNPLKNNRQTRQKIEGQE